MKKDKIKVGDEKWYIASFSNLIIKVKVESVNGNGTDIWIDEPVGNGIYPDELFDSLEDAENAFDSQSVNYTVISLNEWRKRKLKFILSTHGIHEESKIEKELKEGYVVKSDTDFRIMKF